MREIKFRGKRIDNGEWVYGYYVCMNEKEHRIYTGYAETDCGDYYPEFSYVDPETIGQYTGRNDNDGKEIYEGDIVKDKFDGGYTVDYCDDWGAFRAKIIYDYDDDGKKRFFIAGSQSFIGNAWREWEVIGNIHDNPELLEDAI